LIFDHSTKPNSSRLGLGLVLCHIGLDDYLTAVAVVVAVPAVPMAVMVMVSDIYYHLRTRLWSKRYEE
jgi:hypothetical protein